MLAVCVSGNPTESKDLHTKDDKNRTLGKEKYLVGTNYPKKANYQTKKYSPGTFTRVVGQEASLAGALNLTPPAPYKERKRKQHTERQTNYNTNAKVLETANAMLHHPIEIYIIYLSYMHIMLTCASHMYIQGCIYI